jgi:aspartyl aminopeptidase
VRSDNANSEYTVQQDAVCYIGFKDDDQKNKQNETKLMRNINPESGSSRAHFMKAEPEVRKVAN